MRDQARQAYREGILLAAERVFAQRGFGVSRMSDVADEAGLAIGTLYNYFDNKAELFTSLMELRGEQFFAELQGAADSSDDPRQRLVAMVRASLVHIELHKATYMVLVEAAAVNDSEIRRLCGETAEHRFTRIAALYERVFAELPLAVAGVSRADVAAMLTGAMHGMIRSWTLLGGKGSLSDKAEGIVDVFLEGMVPREVP
jgi:AcrR family transcriptional regulator